MVVTRIYEACSFQDITGQRIGKVVTALKAIEGRVQQVGGGVVALNRGAAGSHDSADGCALGQLAFLHQHVPGDAVFQLRGAFLQVGALDQGFGQFHALSVAGCPTPAKVKPFPKFSCPPRPFPREVIRF